MGPKENNAYWIIRSMNIFHLENWERVNNTAPKSPRKSFTNTQN